MSKLKQSVFEKVKVHENIVNGYDQNNPSLEGNIFQCNYNAIDYTPEDFLGVGGGNNISNGSIIRYTFEQTGGARKTVAFEVKKDLELLKTQPIAVPDGDITPTDTFNDLLLFESEGDIYKNGAKYFTRNYTVYSSTNLTSDTDFCMAEDPIIVDSVVRITPANVGGVSQLTATSLIDLLYTSNTENETSADFIFLNSDGLRRFKGSSYFGVIDNTSVVPDRTWFYYDGVDSLGGQLTSIPVAGFYYNFTGADISFADLSSIGSVFADQATATSGELTSYILCESSGGISVSMKDSGAFNAATHITGYSDLLLESEYSNITETTRLWNLENALTSPLVNLDADPVDDQSNASDPLVFQIAPADDLTNKLFWDKVSQNFIEDYDVEVGETGVIGADPNGLYANSGTTGQVVDTYRTIKIASKVNGSSTDNLKLVLSKSHGLTIDQQLNVEITGLTGDDSASINGESVLVNALDENTLEVIGSLDTDTDGEPDTKNLTIDNPTTSSIVTISGFSNFVWREVFLPQSLQGLVYKG